MKNESSIMKRRSKYRDVSYFIQRWILHRPFLVADLESVGLVFKVKTEDVIGRHIYKYHAHEPDISNWLVENVNARPGDVFIDIGANIGWYSVLFDSLAKPGSSVFAFEPDPLNCKLLRTNLELNHAQSVQVIEAAVAETSGISKLYRYGSTNLGRHSLSDTGGKDSIDVPTVSLDDFWDQQSLAGRTVRVLKIDIEGYEYIALKNGMTVLEQCALVICEYVPGLIRSFGVEPAAFLDLLEHAGMRPVLLRNGKLEAMSREVLLNDIPAANLFWMRD